MRGIDRNHFRMLIILIMAALFVRFGALWLFPQTHLDDLAIGAYLGGAHILLDGKGFSDSSYPVIAPPLYAIFIAICSSLFGNEQVSVKIAQAFVDSSTAAFIYLIALEIFGAMTALLAGCIWAMYPFAVYSTISIGAETLFTFFLSGFILLAVYGIRSSIWKLYGGSGILLALATMTRGTTQFFPFVFLLVLLLTYRQRHSWVKHYLAFLLSFTLVMVPWTLRNYIVLNEIIPAATSGGMVLLWGASEEFFTIEEREKTLPAYLETMRAKGIEAESRGPGPNRKINFLATAAIERYKTRLYDEPASIIPFLIKKFARMWYATESGRNHPIILSMNGPIYLLALLGLLLAWRKKAELYWLLVGVLGYFVAIHTITLPLFRYMLPVMPYVIVFAAFFLSTVLEMFQPKTWFSQAFAKVDRASASLPTLQSGRH